MASPATWKPVGPALVVEHHQVALVEGVGVPEEQIPSLQLSAEDHAAETQRTVGDQDRNPPDGVVDDLVEIQDIYGIGEGFVARLLPEDQVVVVEPLQGFGAGIHRAGHRAYGVPQAVLQLIRDLTQRHEPGAGRAEGIEKDLFKGHAMDGAVQFRHGPGLRGRSRRSYRGRLRILCNTLAGDPG